MQVALTPWVGWHREAKEWTGRTSHSGDEASYYSWDERFEHPVRTWASASHRSFTLQSVGIAMAKATYTWMERKSKDAMRVVLGAISEARRARVTPPTAAASVQHAAGDEGWNDNNG